MPGEPQLHRWARWNQTVGLNSFCVEIVLWTFWIPGFWLDVFGDCFTKGDPKNANKFLGLYFHT